ncbi:sulfotransferase family protein [Novosphingobium mangrovi (ex Huang et al. 2023)]|uniref:Sulfotransferase n=1 Tax=Novosphingobium mangrovi (ex Huang et al. 2023) TaxID=2976432 RepID=A0ABT2I5V9_9SPHN|nr:sulfotransferase [Novosphingobium mangrovi (ex Huang et al. 2023)]MCT2400201.1 sulfotransferase [Novosphingobium mangrovi (ex Huang et al. 2023)]
MDLSYDPPEAFRHALDQLHEVVSGETGLTDFGPDDYLPGLKVLLQSMDYDPHFSETGRRVAWGMVVGVLRGRAQAYASMKANPGFADRQILAPVVITGVPRTGTTALHRLLAVDPRFQGLQTWLLDSPMPRPPIETWGDYPEFRATVAQLEAQYAAAPDAKAAHYRAAEEVHECCMVLRQSFVSNLWSCGWSAATYDAWWQCQSEAAAYRHFHKCVQLIGMNDPDKRWLLKNPGHIEHLDLLFAVFPDARVVQTHRDPAKAMPSLVSLLMNLNNVTEGDRPQQRAENLLQREVAKWANAVRKADKVRKTHPGQVLDVVHADFHARPMETVEAIYRFIGMDIPEGTRAALARRIEEKPELRHGVHRYSIADFGMTEDEARAPFGDYVECYDLVERKP